MRWGYILTEKFQHRRFPSTFVCFIFCFWGGEQWTNFSECLIELAYVKVCMYTTDSVCLHSGTVAGMTSFILQLFSVLEGSNILSGAPACNCDKERQMLLIYEHHLLKCSQSSRQGDNLHQTTSQTFDQYTVSNFLCIGIIYHYKLYCFKMYWTPWVVLYLGQAKLNVNQIPTHVADRNF